MNSMKSKQLAVIKRKNRNLNEDFTMSKSKKNFWLYIIVDSDIRKFCFLEYLSFETTKELNLYFFFHLHNFL